MLPRSAGGSVAIVAGFIGLFGLNCGRSGGPGAGEGPPGRVAEAVRDPAAPPDVGRPPEDAVRTESGLAFRVLYEGGDGESPRPGDWVTVRYTGWTTSGIRFDGSGGDGGTVNVPVDAVIEGWSEGLQLMAPGEKRRLWVPGRLAYGEVSGRPEAPTGTLVFDLELLKVHRPPPAPDDVAGPPRGAKKTASGLAYRVLAAGAGTERPRAGSMVRVHYTGWTPDGQMFDSSVGRGHAPRFPLDGVIPGWTEALQRMVVGEKTRFWVPASLGYGANPPSATTPAGKLVFDLELLAID